MLPHSIPRSTLIWINLLDGEMILFCGDPHGEFGHIVQTVQEHRPAAVILLGDLQARRPLEVELAPILSSTQIWFIHGNHDTESESGHDNLFLSALAGKNLHGRVVEIAGLRVAGLGGIFRSKVWAPPAPAIFESREQYLARCGKGNLWRGGLPLKHRSTIFPDDCQRLMTERADILVTHEAPSAHEYGFVAIDELARSLGVTSSFHGHHHQQLDYRSERLRLGFDAFGVGMHGIVDQQGRAVNIHMG